MIDVSLDQFLELSEIEMCDYVKEHAVLFAQQYNRKELDHLCAVADAARTVRKTVEGADFLASLLRNRSVLNFFVQPSSRTFLSFSQAEAMLGMSRQSVRDIKISSMSKGESLMDSIHTFISYVDMIVMRHPDNLAGATAFWTAAKSHRRLKIKGESRPVPIVSGGSGTRQHPTQSLLDIYTLERSFEKTGGIDGKTLMLVGDLKRGRTVRSLSFMMKNYDGVKLIFCAPDEYQMEDDVLNFLDEEGIAWRKVSSIDAGIAEADAVYMTRIQDEWNKEGQGEGHEAAQNDFIFRMKHLETMKPTACLMHPLPKRDEIEQEIDFCDDPRVVYWRQERNGMWMRVALIARLFNVDTEILNYLKNSKL